MFYTFSFSILTFSPSNVNVTFTSGFSGRHGTNMSWCSIVDKKWNLKLELEDLAGSKTEVTNRNDNLKYDCFIACILVYFYFVEIIPFTKTYNDDDVIIVTCSLRFPLLWGPQARHSNIKLFDKFSCFESSLEHEYNPLSLYVTFFTDNSLHDNTGFPSVSKHCEMSNLPML